MQQEVPKAVQQALDDFWKEFTEAQEGWGAKPGAYVPEDGVRRVAINGRAFTKSGNDPWKMNDADKEEAVPRR